MKLSGFALSLETWARLQSPVFIQQLLLNVLFILFQNSRHLILDKSLQNENNCCFNAATVQPYMCICQSLLCFLSGLYPCICSQLFWCSSGFSVNPLPTHRLIRVCWGIMLFQGYVGLSKTVQNLLSHMSRGRLFITIVVFHDLTELTLFKLLNTCHYLNLTYKS